MRVFGLCVCACVVSVAAVVQIASGLVKFVPLDQFIGSMCLVICNLKAAKMRGEMSNGMVLAASNADRTIVELVQPPAGAQPGDRVTIAGVDVSAYQPDSVIDGKKEDTAWTRLRDAMRTTEHIATLSGQPLLVNGQTLKAPTVANGTIS